MKEKIDYICHNGVVFSNQEEILHQFFLFYKELFKSEGNNEECHNSKSIIKQLIPTKISKEDVIGLSEAITKEEIKKSINSMSHDKYPRAHGYLSNSTRPPLIGFVMTCIMSAWKL